MAKKYFLEKQCKIMGKIIYITENQLMRLSESKDEVTFFKFFTEVKNFIKKLLDDPVNAKLNQFFKDNNISGIITNSMYYDGEIKYRTGNLYTFFYDEKGIPKIVIGPDCK